MKQDDKDKKVVVEKSLRSRRSSSATSTIRSSNSPSSAAKWTCCRRWKASQAPARWQDPQVEAVIKSMEIAYRMQTEAPEVFDIRKESQATLETLRSRAYGARLPARPSASSRRASAWCRSTTPRAIRGMRTATSWRTRSNAKNSDQAFAAVIKDLKQRGLWKDTLVVCGSEFGRTPVREVGGGGGSVKKGRDHNPFGFTMWLAGGAVKGGTIYGATDEFGFKAVEKPVHVHDIHATILHLMGIDHTKLTYRYSGRDFRLTDVSGNVLHDLIA